MKRKGFTLIELLAVIVILAIIALIAVPVIMNIIAKSNKSAFKDSAYGIIKAGELYYSDKLLEPNGMEEDKVFTFPNPTGLDIKGSMPSSGKMKVTKEGKVAIAVSNGKYCARKTFDETEVVVDQNIGDCTLPKEPNPYITSDNLCITREGEICPNGNKVNVKVNDLENYDFYVINDTGIELTLIMDRNLGSRVDWINNSDYYKAGGTNYGDVGNNEKGPLTALKALETQTSGWTNIEAKNYTLVDDKPDFKGSTVRYEPIERTNARARMLTVTEAKKLGCTTTSCPMYLKENLSSSNTEAAPFGYWTSSAVSDASPGAWDVHFTDCVRTSGVYAFYGIRPVIEISKTV